MRYLISSSKVYLFFICLFLSLYLSSCTSTKRLEGFSLMQGVTDYSDTSEKKIYVTSTMSIDSVEQSKLIYDVQRIETEDYPKEIRIFTRVYDSLGHFVTNMADPYKKDPNAKYFSTMTEKVGKIYNKKTVPIDKFTVREYGANDSIPFNIVLSVDYSGSMAAVIDAIFEGTEIFAGLKMKYDRIALTSFNKDYDIKVPLMADTAAILSLYRAKRNNNFGLFSAMYDAASKSIDLFEGTSINDPRIVVLFSDGDDNYSKIQVSDVIKKANKNKAHIFTVAFGYSIDENLITIAKNTGGKFYNPKTKEELINVFRDIYMSLRYTYKISYIPPEFWGHHLAISTVNTPKRNDTLFAEAEYDMAGKYEWLKDKGVFERPIQFDFDKDSVKEESFYIINEIVDIMMTIPNLKLEIQGHTDNVGTMEYNQALSERRAKAVYDALIKKGIEERRLRWRGFGMLVPKVVNDTEENKAINRRTEFHVLAR